MRRMWAVSSALVMSLALGGLPVAGQDATATPVADEAATPTRAPSHVVGIDVAYETGNPVLVPGTLDVYAPTEPGPWPVVVMFHGAPGGDPKVDRAGLNEQARRVADLGFVVFNASWGHLPGAYPWVPDVAWLRANNAQGACAIEFARAHAAEYGGDPATLIVFGHSGGAHVAASAVFARPQPTVGCPGGETLGDIDALVTWEGNWLLSVNLPDWDAALAADPGVMEVVTPWSSLTGHRDAKVVMLVSADPGASMRSEFPGLVVDRPVGDPRAADSWLGVRDPSGDLRRQLEANGAFADGKVDLTEVQQLLFSVLEAQGNPVTLDVMPDSSHAWLRGKGWDVFLAAFPKAAAEA